MRLIQYVVFMTVVTAIVGGLHLYFWLRLVHDPALPAPWDLVGLLVLLGLAASQPLAFLLSRALPLAVARVVLLPVFSWMGMLLLLLTFLTAADVLRLVGWGVDLIATGGATLGDADFSLSVSRWIAALALGLTAVLTGFAIPRGLATPRIVQVQVPIAGLAPGLDGLTIAQLTDLHLGPLLGRAWLARVVDRVNAAGPDLVAITGDLVDASVAKLAPAVSELTRLAAPLGTFFVTGNHEFYTGWPAWQAELSRLGIRVLANERVTLQRDAAAFDLAGIHDHDAARVAPSFAPDLDRALDGRDPDRALILLSHEIKIIQRAAAAGVDLVLSGHNHGGQIWPWGYFVFLQQPLLAGLHRREGTWAYISQGTGFWGPPMRLGTRAEITVIRLRSGSADQAAL